VKRLAIVALVSFTTPFLLALYAGGEAITQVGIRLVAIEQGFALAQRHWQFEATPAHAEPGTEPTRVEPLPKPKPRKR
jgi:hypothetical protein